MSSRPLCGSERTNQQPWFTCSQSYGGHGERETPGNIPNPEAKPLSADGTALETGWESRTPPDNTSRRGPSIRAGALRHSRTHSRAFRAERADSRAERAHARCGFAVKGRQIVPVAFEVRAAAAADTAMRDRRDRGECDGAARCRLPARTLPAGVPVRGSPTRVRSAPPRRRPTGSWGWAGPPGDPLRVAVRPADGASGGAARAASCGPLLRHVTSRGPGVGASAGSGQGTTRRIPAKDTGRDDQRRWRRGGRRSA